MKTSRWTFGLVTGTMLLLTSLRLWGQQVQTVFADSWQNGWQNWSWANVSDVPEPAHSGGKSVEVNADAWEALYLHHEVQVESGFAQLNFWIHGGAIGGQKLLVRATVAGNAQIAFNLAALPAGQWQSVSIPLEALGVAGQADFDGFWIQDRAGIRQPAFYVDDIALVTGTTPPASTNSVAHIVVDAARDRHPISELIYGVAFASADQLDALNCPLHRSGGNAETRYNWKLNAHNRGADWYFESIADASPEPGADADQFVTDSKNARAEAMLTVPLIGWVATLGPNRGKLASYSIGKYGLQTGRDAQWYPDAGNGVSVTNDTEIVWNDRSDANVLTDVLFQADWVRHLTNRWGTAANGGVSYYLTDNEPSLWHSTHRDVHPTGATMREIRDRIVEYAARIKAVDPEARIVGPEEWGWSGYFYSGYDQQWGSQHGWNRLPDRTENDGWDYLPWLLDQIRKTSEAANQRLLDVFTVHYYPQGGEYGGDTSAAMQRLRNRSTRALWDPSYLDPSWINDRVRLIPRLKQWVASYYPGTRIGLTEYNWGAEGHINGATAQADLLGIFGREGLDVATRWTTPRTDSPTFKAMQMFRNYDGKNSTFGDVSISAVGPNPDVLAVFGAKRTRDGAVTVIAINKTNAITPVDLVLTNVSVLNLAQVWQLTGGNQISRLSDATLTNAQLQLSLPAQSITLLVIPAIDALHIRVVARTDEVFQCELAGPSAGVFIMEQSANLRDWSPVLTNRFDGGKPVVALPLTDPSKRFFRALLPP